MLELIDKLIALDHKFCKGIHKANIFVAAGLLRQEVRHSSILAFLLDPKGWHGIGDLLLRYFVTAASRNRDDALEIAFKSLDDASVSTEVSIGAGKGGRLDILVKSRSCDLCLAIENKVDARQGDTQLVDYRKWINEHDDLKNATRKLLVYLTLNEDDEANDEEWTSLSYLDLTEWLEKALDIKADTVTEYGRIYITQYIDLVRGHVMENDDQELINYCQNLWHGYGHLLNKVIEYQPTPAIDAMKRIVGEANGESESYEQIARRKDRLYFIPKSLKPHMEMTEIMGGGWGWPSPGYPLHFEFVFKETKDGNQTVALLIYVGPSAERKQLIAALREEGLKPAGKYREETGKFARIWDVRPVGIKDASVEEIEGKMKSLLEKAADDKVIEKIISALKRCKPALKVATA